MRLSGSQRSDVVEARNGQQRGGGPDGGQRSNEGGGEGASEGEEAAATKCDSHPAGCCALLDEESDADTSDGWGGSLQSG